MTRFCAIVVACLSLAACTDDVISPRPAPAPRRAASTISQLPTISVAQVSAGDIQTCAVKLNGTVACWGAHPDLFPPSQETFSQVGTGFYHSCALRTDQTIGCWGGNDSGQTNAPSGAFTQISAGGRYNCALRADQTVACWGQNDYGQATPPGGTFRQVAAGMWHTCGLKSDQTIACWGADITYGAGAPAGTFTQITSAGSHSCALRPDASLVCWGDNYAGEKDVPPGTYSQVSAGWHFTCAIKTDASLACWGYNYYGEATPPAGAFTQVSAGGFHACAVRTDQTVACWGLNHVGQATPPLVNGPPAVNMGGIYDGTEGVAVTFLWSATDPNSDALTYQWNFGDGTTGSGTSLPSTHTYVDDGTYLVTLTATDPLGASDTQQTTVRVVNAKPVVSVGADVTISAGQSLNLSGTFTDRGLRDAPWTYTIDWGNGSTTTGSVTTQSSAITASRQYLTPGTYTVTLVVTDNEGAFGWDALVLTVRPLNVTIDIKPGDSPNSISLSDQGNAQIAVAILSSPSFDARLIDPATVQLGATAVSARRNGSLFASLADVDGDGDLDLVVHFDRAQLVANGDLTTATTSLVLVATLIDGRLVEGRDDVRVIP